MLLEAICNYMNTFCVGSSALPSSALYIDLCLLLYMKYGTGTLVLFHFHK